MHILTHISPQVLHFDGEKFRFIRSFGEDYLTEPLLIHVRDDGLIFVLDGNSISMW